MANVVKFANIGTTRGARGEVTHRFDIKIFFEKREREFSKRGILFFARPIFALLLGKVKIRDFPGRSCNFRREKSREDKLKIACTCLKQIWSVMRRSA